MSIDNASDDYIVMSSEYGSYDEIVMTSDYKYRTSYYENTLPLMMKISS